MRDQLMDQFRAALERAGTDADLVAILAGPGYAESCNEEELIELIEQFEAIANSAAELREALPLAVFDFKHRLDLRHDKEQPPEQEEQGAVRGTGQLQPKHGTTTLLGPSVPVRPLRLEGPKVLLRELTDKDAEDVFAYASDPEVTRYLAWGPSQNIQDSRGYIHECRIENQAGLALTLGVEWKQEARVIGAIALFNVQHAHGVAELGFVLHRRVWGRGISSEMTGLMLHYGFNAMRLERIEAWSVAENARSIGLLEKLGMTREGLLRRQRVYKGEPCDRVVFGLLRQDWERLLLSQ